MADMIRNSMSWLGGRMKAFATLSVVYASLSVSGSPATYPLTLTATVDAPSAAAASVLLGYTVPAGTFTLTWSPTGFDTGAYLVNWGQGIMFITGSGAILSDGGVFFTSTVWGFSDNMGQDYPFSVDATSGKITDPTLPYNTGVSFTGFPLALPVTLAATVGPSQSPIDVSSVVELSYEWRDFSFTAADLVDRDGATLVPQRGDTITAILGGVSQTYQLMLDGTNSVWSWTDSSHTRRKVRGKLIA